MGTAGHAGVQGNPANMPAHDLHDHHTVVGFSGGVQPVNGIGCHGYCGVKTEGKIGAIHIVVNGLRHPHNRNPVIGEPFRAFQRSLTTDGNQRVNFRVSEVFFNFFNSIFKFVGMQTSGTQDRSAAQQDSVNVFVVIELNSAVFHKTDPSVFVTNYCGTVFGAGGADDSSDNRVEAGTVTTRS